MWFGILTKCFPIPSLSQSGFAIIKLMFKRALKSEHIKLFIKRSDINLIRKHIAVKITYRMLIRSK